MISEIIDEGQKRMASRTIGKGEDAYTETLKQFTGIPADVCAEMTDLIKRRKAEAGRRLKIGDVYGEALTAYMNAVEAGDEVADIKASAKGGNAVKLGVWLRDDIVDRFEAFVAGLGEGGESEALSAAVRWFLARN